MLFNKHLRRHRVAHNLPCFVLFQYYHSYWWWITNSWFSASQTYTKIYYDNSERLVLDWITYVYKMINNKELHSEMRIEIKLFLIVIAVCKMIASISERVWNFQRGLNSKWQALYFGWIVVWHFHELQLVLIQGSSIFFQVFKWTSHNTKSYILCFEVASGCRPKIWNVIKRRVSSLIAFSTATQIPWFGVDWKCLTRHCKCFRSDLKPSLSSWMLIGTFLADYLSHRIKTAPCLASNGRYDMSFKNWKHECNISLTWYFSIS